MLCEGCDGEQAAFRWTCKRRILQSPEDRRRQGVLRSPKRLGELAQHWLTRPGVPSADRSVPCRRTHAGKLEGLRDLPTGVSPESRIWKRTSLYSKQRIFRSNRTPISRQHGTATCPRTQTSLRAGKLHGIRWHGIPVCLSMTHGFISPRRCLQKESADRRSRPAGAFTVVLHLLFL